MSGNLAPPDTVPATGAIAAGDSPAGESGQRSAGDGLRGLLGENLLAAVTELRTQPSRPVRVLDCGGGSGSLAVPLAVTGCHVTVVDTSIDALSTLQRRAREAGVDRQVLAVQGDIEGLDDVVQPASMDLVLLHGVVVPGPAARGLLTAAARAVRPGGQLSVLAANPVAAVLARALSGELEAAQADLDADAEPVSLDGLSAITAELGFDVVLAQGIGAFSATVSGTVLSPRPRAAQDLDRLDRSAAGRSPYRDVAGSLHLLCVRRADGEAALS